jgi:hypothetical protein
MRYPAISKDIKFNKHGNTIVPAHVQPLIFNEQEFKAHTPTGSRHKQRRKKHGPTNIKRREASGQHPALEELPSSDSNVDPNSDEDRATASGDDLDPEDQPPGTVRKVPSGNGFSLNELLALEAGDGQGHKEEEEEVDGSDASDYVEIEDEDSFNETDHQQVSQLPCCRRIIGPSCLGEGEVGC